VLVSCFQHYNLWQLNFWSGKIYYFNSFHNYQVHKNDVSQLSVCRFLLSLFLHWNLQTESLYGTYEIHLILVLVPHESWPLHIFTFTFLWGMDILSNNTTLTTSSHCTRHSTTSKLNHFNCWYDFLVQEKVYPYLFLLLVIVPAPDDRWGWLWSNWWNEDWQGKPMYSEKTCPSATLSATNPTWPDPGSNPVLRDGKPATNRGPSLSLSDDYNSQSRLNVYNCLIAQCHPAAIWSPLTNSH
jgi:hypothetical protein